MTELKKFKSIADMIRQLRPEMPVYCLDGAELARNVRQFVEHFPGTTLFAVKCNPHPALLEVIAGAGIDHFDVASIGEIERVGKQFPQARMFFMHPVKTATSIAAAARNFAVRDFVVDHIDELRKVSAALDASAVRDGIRVFVRIKTRPAVGTSFVLSKKFGAEKDEAVRLLREIRGLGFAAGVAFHVGSQCTTAEPYRDALDDARSIIEASGVDVAAIDVGGGFPAYYPEVKAPPLQDYFATIARGLEPLRAAKRDLEVYCEPGRAIVASALAVVTQVHLRKDNMLYLNDGFYGSLCEAQQSQGTIKLSGYTTTAEARREGARELFSLYGPTCDSCDSLGDAVRLDAGTATGDWVVFENMGAYSNALVTDFNGFQSNYFVAIARDGDKR